MQPYIEKIYFEIIHDIYGLMKISKDEDQIPIVCIDGFIQTVAGLYLYRLYIVKKSGIHWEPSL